MNSAVLPIHPIAALWQNLHSRVLFKFILPHVQHATLEGVKLDISRLSPLMKNHIRTGRYEVQERRLAQQSLTRDDVILELGGAIGFIGLYCRKVIGVKHHLSVEANPNTHEHLKGTPGNSKSPSNMIKEWRGAMNCGKEKRGKFHSFWQPWTLR